MQMAEDLQMEFMHSNGSDIPEELIEIQNNVGNLMCVCVGGGVNV